MGTPNPNYGVGGDTRTKLYSFCEYDTSTQKLNLKVHEWGDSVLPVEHVYDALGRQTQMNTFATSTATFKGTSTTPWPASPNNGQATQWSYQTASGVLLSKTDASGTPVSYTYTAANQVYITTNKRGQTTTYAYSATTAELTSETYSDGTTALVYTYDRLGNRSTVVDDAGTRSFAYNLSGTRELVSETFTAGLFSGKALGYAVDTSTTGAKGRPISFNYDSNTLATSYGYQADGRLSTIASGGNTFTYGYATNSHLIGTITSGSYVDTRVYEARHDWNASRTTTYVGNSVPVAAFSNTFDTTGQVTAVAKTGALFSVYGNTTSGLTTNYAYDDRSQLKAEQTIDATNSTVLAGRNNGTAASPGYTYDNMGNRVSATHNGNTTSYAVNNLNQYVTRAVPPVIDVAWLSTTAPVVITDNGSAPTDTLSAATSGIYFFDGYNHTNTDNSTSAKFRHLLVNSKDLYGYLPPQNFTLLYDADGNLTNDGTWVYSYNAKNQLTSVATSSTALGTTPAAPNVTYAYTYDYLGRRIKKTYTTSSGTTEERFIYNGWNLVAVLNSSNAILRNFVWGPDLSGTLQGAGGVGGLLMVREGATGNSYLPAYDTNGNVHGLIATAAITLNGNAYTAGSLVATYEFDAFGNTLRESGDYAASNPFRFATKYADVETGLVQYNTRYYSPSLGRFINRDSIGEQGGLNLYAYCGNNSVNHWDCLGNIINIWFGLNFVADGFTFTGSIIPGHWDPFGIYQLSGIDGEDGIYRITGGLGLVWSYFGSEGGGGSSRPKSADIVTLKPDQKMLVIYNGGAPRGFDNSPANADGAWFEANAKGLQNRNSQGTVYIQDISAVKGEFPNGTIPQYATRLLQGEYRGMDVVTIIDHSGVGAMAIGGHTVDTDAPFWSEISKELSADGPRTVQLFGCNVASIRGDLNGVQYLQQAAKINNLTIRGAAFDVNTNKDGTLNLDQTPSNAVWVFAKPDGTVNYEEVHGGSAAPVADPRKQSTEGH